ncbi:PEP-CTERM sorting domain-containing protein [Methylotenera sp.]|uniref:PEP-CTERM sorting domain-containing protein n=1 Tax=Methylotenera sp. TaxID=2051956 RepID=UPI00248853AE|nr:PEP-CTERM sorting domain-containing protein [Methylotenera sp.]MDI1362701.1 hypothetical protein [Methylotenera sp.]
MKIQTILLGLVLFLSAFQVNANVCSATDQIDLQNLYTSNLSTTACNNNILTNNGGFLNGINQLGLRIYSSLSNFNTLINNGSFTNYFGNVNNSQNAILSNNANFYNDNFSSIDNYGVINNSGSISNSGTISNNVDGLIINYGAINSVGEASNIGISNSGTLVNSYGATISAKGLDGGFTSSSNIANSGTLINNGEIVISYSTGIQNSGILINNGVIKSVIPVASDMSTGTIYSTGRITNNGTMNFDYLNASVVDGTGTYTIPGLSWGGSSNSEFANVGLMTQERINILNGVMTVGSLNAGIVNLSSTSTLNVTNGNIETLSGGTTQITGILNADNVIGGVLGFQINGTAPGAFSSLSVKNSANLLASTLSYLFQFNGNYSPTVGDHWLFLNAGNGFANAETFNSSFSQLVSNKSVGFTINAVSTGMELVVFSVPIPEANSYAMFLTGLGIFGFMSRRRKNEQA